MENWIALFGRLRSRGMERLCAWIGSLALKSMVPQYPRNGLACLYEACIELTEPPIHYYTVVSVYMTTVGGKT
jgi:hypothetical protein